MKKRFRMKVDWLEWGKVSVLFLIVGVVSIGAFYVIGEFVRVVR